MKDITEILNRHMHSVSQQKQCTQTQTALQQVCLYFFAENKIKPFVKTRFVSVKQAFLKI